MRQVRATLLPKKSMRFWGRAVRVLGKYSEPHGSWRNVFNLREGYIGIMFGHDYPTPQSRVKNLDMLPGAPSLEARLLADPIVMHMKSVTILSKQLPGI